MAKCPICNSRKGKRKCAVVDGSFVCSQCCGTSRSEETCEGCVYYQPPRRKYSEVPSFSVLEMRDDFGLQGYSDSVEGALSTFNVQNQDKLMDTDAIGIYELLMDKYHFKDEVISSSNALWQEGFDYVDKAIAEDMGNVDDETVSKVLGAVRISARKRTDATGREYINFIGTYVGQRQPGLGVVRHISS